MTESSLERGTKFCAARSMMCRSDSSVKSRLASMDFCATSHTGDKGTQSVIILHTQVLNVQSRALDISDG